MGKRRKQVEPIEIVHPNAAGLDIGASEIYGCVPPDRAGDNVKVFGTFTPDLHHLADWLVANRVDTVARILLANPRLRRWSQHREGRTPSACKRLLIKPTGNAYDVESNSGKNVLEFGFRTTDVAGVS